jgi:ribosomal protein S1
MVWLAAVTLAAHEGHDRRIMGTVAAIHENHVRVAATDKKDHILTLNDKTKIVRGTTALKAADLKVGDRVVVVATEIKEKDGTTSMMVKEVKVGTAIAAARKKQ